MLHGRFRRVRLARHHQLPCVAHLCDLQLRLSDVGCLSYLEADLGPHLPQTRGDAGWKSGRVRVTQTRAIVRGEREVVVVVAVVDQEEETSRCLEAFRRVLDGDHRKGVHADGGGAS